MSLPRDRVKVVLAPIVSCCAAISVAWAPQPAAAHTQSGTDWYFYGSTYKEREPTKANQKDPVNVIFLGGPGDKTSEVVGQHISDDWDEDPLGTEGKPMRERICRKNQWMAFRDLRGNRDEAETDLHRMTNCGPFYQYHFRLWEDTEHEQQTRGPAHIPYSWMVGNIHRDRISPKFCGPRFGPQTICGFTHVRALPWDTAKHNAIIAMRRHCSYENWQYHPSAHQTYQDDTFSGWIARISLQHTSSGCLGA